MVVHIVQEKRKKPFLGGYKHRLTGVEFHNASTQTIPRIRVPSFVEKFHRDTQTTNLETESSKQRIQHQVNANGIP